MEHFYQNIEGWSDEYNQGSLLTEILGTINTKDNLKIAEIGVYKGRGTSIWNVILINSSINYEYIAIDHFMGSDEHEKGIDYYNMALTSLEPILDKIKVVKNDSISESKNYNDSYFDIVYIDASHDYNSVMNDIKSWLPKIKKGGVMCGDDYLIPNWPEVVKAVNDVFGESNVKVIGNNQWLVNV